MNKEYCVAVYAEDCLHCKGSGNEIISKDYSRGITTCKIGCVFCGSTGKAAKLITLSEFKKLMNDETCII